MIASSVMLMAALLHAPQESPGGRISGSVVERGTGTPLAGVTIRLRPGIAGASTDNQGKFTLERIPDGTYTLQASLLGYRKEEAQNVIVRAGAETTFVVSMEETPIQVSQVVVTASRREQSLQDVPMTVTTINADALAYRLSTTLDDALRAVSGVTMIDDQINIRGSSGYSRGVGSRVLLLVDGAPYLTGDTGEINWESLPIDQVDHVEVVKGAGSALYGSSALGGVVNVITRRIEEGSSVKVRSFGGAYDRPPYSAWSWTPSTRFTSGVFVTASERNGSAGFLLGASRLMDEGYRQNDVVHKYAIFGRSDLELGDMSSLQITGNIVRRVNGNFFWWKSLHEPLRPPDDHQKRWVRSTRGYISATYRSVTGTGALITARGQYYGNAWSDEEGSVVNNTSKSDVGFGELQWTQDAGSGHQIVAGLTASVAQVRSNIFGNHPGLGAAAFIQDDVTLSPATTVSAGVRLDWERVSALTPRSQVDPKLGMTLKASETTTFRGSIGRGFRYPSIAELFTFVATGFGSTNVVPNPNLRAERSFSLEAGIAQLIAQNTWLDVSIFHAEYRDLIEAGVDPKDRVIRFDNVHRARITGTEISAGAEWFERALTTTAGYTLMDPRNVTTNSVLRFRPRHIAVAAVQGKMGGWDAGMEYRFVGKIEAIDEQLVTLANIVDGDKRVPVHVLDVRAFRTLTDLGIPARIGLTVRNVLNYQYVELVGNMAPPRTYVLSIDAAFE